MKMFNKILAVILTVFTLISALPMSVIADDWFVVDAETAGSSSTVTVEVDAGALAEILEKNGISKALLADLKNGVAVDPMDILK